MATRHQNRGLRKVCGCARRTWAKCPHPWHFNFKLRGGPAYRFSLDAHTGRHVATKAEAEALADTLRGQIRAGTFARTVEPKAQTVALAPATVAIVGRRFLDRKGTAPNKGNLSYLAKITRHVHDGAPLGDLPIAALTADVVEAFFAQLRRDEAAASTINKYVTLWKGLCRWATKKGYLPADPILDSEDITRSKHAQRSRRLDPGEEAALLAHASPTLQRLILGALETGCRRGELLGLQWRAVNLERREFKLRAEDTKTETARTVAISARLLAVLLMARTGPDGKPFGPDAYVFGDVVGGAVKDIKRAWATCVLKAHGHVPAWTAQKGLTAASRAALGAINLHFHDLRHEAASRWHEGGWTLAEIQAQLGHSNIKQTSTYLNVPLGGVQQAMRRFDDARGCNPVAIAAPTDPAPVRNADGAPDPQVTVN